MFPNSLAIIGGPKLSLYDIRKLDSPSFSTISNLKSLTSVHLTSSKVITSGLDGMIKVYKYSSGISSQGNLDKKTGLMETDDENKFLELSLQMKQDEGIVKFAVDPFCMNYCSILANGKLSLFQKNYFKDEKVRAKVLEQQGLANINQILENSKINNLKDPVFASIAGIKYSEKMLARKLGRGLRNIDRGSYKYYNRGLYSKFDINYDGDQINSTTFIQQEKVLNLSKFDKFLRKFQFKEALVKVLQTGNSQKILGILEQLMIQDHLDTALAQFKDEESSLLLLKFLVKKMNSENCQGIISYLSERYLEILESDGKVTEEVFEWVKRLAQKVEEELLKEKEIDQVMSCLLYTSPSPRDLSTSRMPSSA